MSTKVSNQIAGSACRVTACNRRLRRHQGHFCQHDISQQFFIIIIFFMQVPENATTKDVIKQAVAKAGSTAGSEHEYVLLEEVGTAQK